MCGGYATLSTSTALYDEIHISYGRTPDIQQPALASGLVSVFSRQCGEFASDPKTTRILARPHRTMIAFLGDPRDAPYPTA
ncbi:hypothetical protein NM688_g612 [Phlebia brevispora]|uniref:Uncharacterized protein n=1 Tax=Phlebia brevispora TaxID=194682 RepID=A0ACC1TE13_9APHY|nr:hypothetical protein NM688_g612 [Phlebia brevispora]